VGYSSFLGAVGGVLIADYFVIRRTRLNQAGLYERSGPYWYTGGFNLCAMISLLAGITLFLPGFLAQLGVLALEKNSADAASAGLPHIADIWGTLYDFAWFTSFFTAFVLYIVLMMATIGRKNMAANER
jgi:NCS1 family nucleobase:cation symporter-1